MRIDATRQGGLCGGLLPGIYPPPTTMRPPLVGERWSVVPGNPLVKGELPCRYRPSVLAGAPPLSTTVVATIVASGSTFSASSSDTLDGGPVIPELVIMCSTRGVQSWLVEGHSNSLRPIGRSCFTPPAPTILRKGRGRARMRTFDCSGGDVIFQVLSEANRNTARHGIDPQEAADAPRTAAVNFHGDVHRHRSVDQHVLVESRIDADAMMQLSTRGNLVEPRLDSEFDAGPVQNVMQAVSDDGEPVCALPIDPRRSVYAHAR